MKRLQIMISNFTASIKYSITLAYIWWGLLVHCEGWALIYICGIKQIKILLRFFNSNQ